MSSNDDLFWAKIAIIYIKIAMCSLNLIAAKDLNLREKYVVKFKNKVVKFLGTKSHQFK